MEKIDNETAIYIFGVFLKKFSYAKKARENGFYVEAIARIDSEIDFYLDFLLNLCVNKNELELLEIIKNKAKRQRLWQNIVMQLLIERGVISKNSEKRISKFKENRNILIHNFVGLLPDLLIKTEKLDIESVKKLEEEEKGLLENYCNEGDKLIEDLIKESTTYLQKTGRVPKHP